MGKAGHLGFGSRKELWVFRAQQQQRRPGSAGGWNRERDREREGGAGGWNREGSMNGHRDGSAHGHSSAHGHGSLGDHDRDV